MSKFFFDAIEYLDIPLNDYNNLENCTLENVKISYDNKNITFIINSKKILDEDNLKKLEKELTKKMDCYTKVQISVKYTYDSCEKALYEFYPNLVSFFTDSPLEEHILKNSTKQIEGNTISISADNSSLFLMSKLGTEYKIKKIINNRFDFEPQILFTENKNKKQINTTFIAKQSMVFKEPQVKAEKTVTNEQQQPRRRARKKSGVKIVESITDSIESLNNELLQDSVITVEGNIFEMEKREIRSGNYLIILNFTDFKNSISVKFFIDPDTFKEEFAPVVYKGANVKIKGFVQYDMYSKELVISANEIAPINILSTKKMDNAEVKRVELHLHTNMSSMDGLTHISKYINRADELGHNILSITDHGVVQAFPDAMNAVSKINKNRDEKMKILYGIEAYIIDDLEPIVSLSKGEDFNTEFVVFDLETTGLYSYHNKIIEIGAVKIKNGEIIDEFSELINPEETLDLKIVELTNITDEMLKDKPKIETIMPKFIQFIENSVLVAHNANFDIGFLNAQCKNTLNIDIENTFLDTVNLSRLLYPQIKNHKLNTLSNHLQISLENHHRAVDDAKATTTIFLKELLEVEKLGITNLNELNKYATENLEQKRLQAYHGIIFAKNEKGLENLYRLVSDSHLNNFFRRPRMRKSVIEKHREGLILGSACEAGEVFKSIIGTMPDSYIIKKCNFYDYMEVQPIGNNMYLYRKGAVKNIEDLCRLNIEIIKYGEELGKLTVATGDVHFLDDKDEYYRRILQNAEGFKDADEQPPLFYRTTEEMLSEFEYLSKEKAYEIVVTNPNKIADEIDYLLPIPEETYPPIIEGSDDELRKITYDRATEIYGENLPEIVEKRLERELTSIIKNGFSVMYIIAQKLVWNSLEAGYLVGSRGSVGSSFAATMAQITEVNPLHPHYICPNCKYSDFDSDEVKAYSGWSGYDLPDKICPECGAELNKDGHDIPFETFLGFDGDKEPDIDLNFSGEYQAKAHAYTEELFGEGYVFKAGTIGTLADKTAAGFVLKYAEEKNIELRRPEVTRLANNCTGVKRTTGQHPGGLMVVPDYTDVHKFTPLQRPANDVKSDITTTHFDYHSISGRLLKLDILGHTAPTIIKMLHESTGLDPMKVDLGDEDIMSLFQGKKALGLNENDIKCPTGSLGIPEFGTSFVRKMLIDTNPSTFTELVRISGLSHGTDVWLNNAQDLIQDGTCTLKDVIATRDDIMVYLINCGVESLTAFKIMESARKGKLSPDNPDNDDYFEALRAAKVPEWYIKSIATIKYLFPKGHAVAYVLMSVRIAYFKIHYPAHFYAATYSISAEDFDYELMCKGIDNIKREIGRIASLSNEEKTQKDKSAMDLLELLEEMYMRNIVFLPLDLYESHSKKFIVKDNGILPPLCTITGLGVSAAESIVEERAIEKFTTIEELRNRTKVNKNVVEIMKNNNMLKGMSETNQLSLF